MSLTDGRWEGQVLALETCELYSLTIEQGPCPGSGSWPFSIPSTPVVLHWLALACKAETVPLL